LYILSGGLVGFNLAFTHNWATVLTLL